MVDDATHAPRVMQMRGRGAASELAWWRGLVVIAGIMVAAMVILGIEPRLELLGIPCDGPTCAPQQVTAFETSRLQGAGIDLNTYAAFTVALEAVATVGWFGMAGLLLWTRKSGTVTILAALSLIAFGATFSGFIDALASRGDGWSVPVASVNWLGFVALTGFLLLFPDGSFARRFDRWLLPVAAAAFWAIYAVPRAALDPKTSLPGILLVLGILGLALASQVSRYRRISPPVQRQQAKWVVAGVVTLVVGFFAVIALDVVNHELYGFRFEIYAAELVLFAVVKLALPVSLVLAIRRHRLWDIDALINRTIVYAALTVGVVGIYVAVVGYLGSLFRTGSNMTVSLVATGVVAVIFQPMRNRLQRGVNRLMFGDRDDPWTVIANLGDRLEAALAPEAVLPSIVTTIRDALKVPYVAIATGEGVDLEIVAASGSPGTEDLQIPLTARGERVGALIVAPRDAGVPWAHADVRLLQELARQAGAAVQGLQLTRELQASREKLVRSREDERRRLRNDLHDDLAPTLASLSLTAATARALVDRDPDTARQLMNEVQQGARAAVGDVRRIVYNLRPPALDELGLLGAITERAQHLSMHRHVAAGEERVSSLDVAVCADGDLSGIPAAVEVAAYRIVQEALSNVDRHSGATRCTVTLTREENAPALVIDVVDDGRGIAGGARRGVGLTSMRERSAEIGGTLEISAHEPHGTRVHACLPITREDR